MIHYQKKKCKKLVSCCSGHQDDLILQHMESYRMMILQKFAADRPITLQL